MIRCLVATVDVPWNCLVLFPEPPVTPVIIGGGVVHTPEITVTGEEAAEADFPCTATVAVITSPEANWLFARPLSVQVPVALTVAVPSIVAVPPLALLYTVTVEPWASTEVPETSVVPVSSGLFTRGGVAATGGKLLVCKLERLVAGKAPINARQAAGAS